MQPPSPTIYKKIMAKSNWKGPEIEDSPDWKHTFEEREMAEIDAALNSARSNGKTLATLRREDFPLPQVGRRLDAMRLELEDGLGMFIFRGIPTDRYPKDDLRFIYWGLGLNTGTAVSQSKRNDYLGDVRDLGTGLSGPKFRGYTSSGALTYHTDAADVTGLFCMRPAKSGGLSHIVSAAAVHNEILATRPDLLEVLYQPYYWSRQGNERPGEQPYYTQPIFAVEDGCFASRYTPTHIWSADKMDGIPGLSPIQREALELIESICERPDFHATLMYEPGDIFFFNNHLTYHTRTAFEDYEEPDQKRHLLRLWLSIPNGRPLSEGFRPFFGDVRAGAVRGGFPGHDDAEAMFTTI